MLSDVTARLDYSAEFTEENARRFLKSMTQYKCAMMDIESRFNLLNEEYALEYGTATIEMHKDAIQPGQKVVIVDDLMATGGTAKAIVEMVEEMGAEVSAMLFLIELDFLEGRKALPDYKIESVIHY